MTSLPYLAAPCPHLCGGTITCTPCPAPRAVQAEEWAHHGDQLCRGQAGVPRGVVVLCHQARHAGVRAVGGPWCCSPRPHSACLRPRSRDGQDCHGQETVHRSPARLGSRPAFTLQGNTTEGMCVCPCLGGRELGRVDRVGVLTVLCVCCVHDCLNACLPLLLLRRRRPLQLCLILWLRYFNALRMEVADRNVDVSLVCPGPVESEVSLSTALLHRVAFKPILASRRMPLPS